MGNPLVAEDVSATLLGVQRVKLKRGRPLAPN